MMTNTYLPQVGGVARSVASFTEEFRRRGHRVLVVAPTYADLPEVEVERRDQLRHPGASWPRSIRPFSKPKKLGSFTELMKISGWALR